MTDPRAAARRLLWILFLALLLGSPAPALYAAAAQADVPTESSARDLAVAKPEDVGMSSERLTRLSKAMQKVIDDGQLAGITTMIARHGKIVHFETFGNQNLEAKTPMAKDSIFRIYSMSKPITGVALMMLYEEGKFRLSDPVEKYIPEWKDMKVATSEGPEGPAVEDGAHPMTIRELMSHTGGLTYGFFSRVAGRQDVPRRRRARPRLDAQDMVGKLAKIPLRQQPGDQVALQRLGRRAGLPGRGALGPAVRQFLKQRLFGPLGMKDTAFWVPRGQGRTLRAGLQLRHRTAAWSRVKASAAAPTTVSPPSSSRAAVA